MLEYALADGTAVGAALSLEARERIHRALTER